MVIGGYDPRLNAPGSEMEYTPATKSSGWFTVKVPMPALRLRKRWCAYLATAGSLA